jgi:hypothetical protein
MGGELMTRRVAWSVLVLFVLAAGMGVISLFWQAHATNASRAAQQRQGQIIGRKICQTLGQLAALSPPTRADVKKGAPYPPSFTYEDQLHATLSQLGTDLGCPTRKAGK